MYLWKDFEVCTDGFDRLINIISNGKPIGSASDGSVISDGRALLSRPLWRLAEKCMDNDVSVDPDQDLKTRCRCTILVDSSLEEMSSFRSEAMGTLTTAIILHLLRLFTETQHPSTSIHTCDNDGLVEKVNYLIQKINKTILSDPVDADLVLPTGHWGFEEAMEDETGTRTCGKKET